MGKKKDKSEKSNYFEYYTGSGKIGNLMDRFDVEGAKSYHPDGRSMGKTGSRSMEDVDKDIAKKMMGDYDYRRSMEAAAMAGEKDAKKFAKKGFKGGNIYEAADTMRALKDKYVGGGGMNGPKNQAGLTHALVQADRDAFTKKIQDMIPDAPEQQKAAEEATTKEEVVLSDHMQKAKDRVDQWESGNQPIYNPEARDVQKNGYESPFASQRKKVFGIDEEISVTAVNKEQDDPEKQAQSAAQAYLDKKKEDVKDQFNFTRVY